MRLRWAELSEQREDRFHYEVLYKKYDYSPSYQANQSPIKTIVEKLDKFRAKYITEPLNAFNAYPIITFMQKMKKLVQELGKVCFQKGIG